MIYKTQHKKIKIDEHEPRKNRRCSGIESIVAIEVKHQHKSGENSCAPEWLAFPAPRVALFVLLLLNDTNVICRIRKSYWTPAFVNKYN
jgi:hypothetical protein